MNQFGWVDMAKRLDAIAQTGLSFAQNEYDKERYQEIRTLAHDIFQQYTDAPLKKINDLFERDNGYPTPKVDIRGVVFRHDKILMVQEKLDMNWALPGGWADIGLSPTEVVVKEVREEAGIIVVPVRLLAVLDKKKHDHPPSPIHVYKIFILCKETYGEPEAGMETLCADFFRINELPQLSLERNTQNQVEMVYRLYKNPALLPVID